MAMTKSQERVAEKTTNIGPAVCEICSEKKADVIKVKKSWFSSFEVCDSCFSAMFGYFDKNK